MPASGAVKRLLERWPGEPAEAAPVVQTGESPRSVTLGDEAYGSKVVGQSKRVAWPVSRPGGCSFGTRMSDRRQPERHRPAAQTGTMHNENDRIGCREIPALDCLFERDEGSAMSSLPLSQHSVAAGAHESTPHDSEIGILPSKFSRIEDARQSTLGGIWESSLGTSSTQPLAPRLRPPL